MPAPLRDAKPSTLNEELVQIAKCLSEVGPNINEIARRTGQYKETVRYRYHTFILDEGFTITAVPDYSKLGMKRLVMEAKLAPQFEPHAQVLLSAMSELCYLHGFTQVILGGSYILYVTVPSELCDRCIELYREFQRMGIFVSLDIHRFEEAKYFPMKPEYYDFENASWSYDWSRGNPPAIAPSARQPVEKYDKVDLMLLKELDEDANQTLVQISKDIGVQHKTVGFHYVNHIQPRRLIKGYTISWQGTRRDLNADGKVVTSRPHRYMNVAVLLTGAAEGERSELVALLERIPFLWSSASDPDYFAELFIPPSSFVDFLSYLREFAGRAGKKFKMMVTDQTNSLKFVIFYKLFDEATRKWQLDTADAIVRFEKLAMRINSGEK